MDVSSSTILEKISFSKDVLLNCMPGHVWEFSKQLFKLAELSPLFPSSIPNLLDWIQPGRLHSLNPYKWTGRL